jgi:hypothetical protein
MSAILHQFVASQIYQVPLSSLPYWNYVSEGNANVVLSYHGSQHPSLIGKALRVRKLSEKLPPNDPISFVKKIVKPLLGEDGHWVPEYEEVELSNEFLAGVQKMVKKHRPERRKQREENKRNKGEGIPENEFSNKSILTENLIRDYHDENSNNGSDFDSLVIEMKVGRSLLISMWTELVGRYDNVNLDLSSCYR